MSQAGERMLVSQWAPVSGGGHSLSVLLPQHIQLNVHILSRLTAADRGNSRAHSGCTLAPVPAVAADSQGLGA